MRFELEKLLHREGKSPYCWQDKRPRGGNCRAGFICHDHLNREFGADGMYRNIQLFNFVDNHDVNRIASTLDDCNLLHLIYALMFCIPGLPSIYYGSEWGIRGKRGDCDDYQLRPALPPFADRIPDFASPDVDSNALVETIKRFADTRAKNPALQLGDYRELFVSNLQFAFERSYKNQHTRVFVNLDSRPAKIKINGHPEVEVPAKWIVIE